MILPQLNELRPWGWNETQIAAFKKGCKRHHRELNKSGWGKHLVCPLRKLKPSLFCSILSGTGLLGSSGSSTNSNQDLKGRVLITTTEAADTLGVCSGTGREGRKVILGFERPSSLSLAVQVSNSSQ
jgi:hypothetical protein